MLLWMVLVVLFGGTTAGGMVLVGDDFWNGIGQVASGFVGIGLGVVCLILATAVTIWLDEV